LNRFVLDRRYTNNTQVAQLADTALLFLPVKPNAPPGSTPSHRPSKALAVTTTAAPPRPSSKHDNKCLTHGFSYSKEQYKSDNHKGSATAADMMGGSTRGSSTKSINALLLLLIIPLPGYRKSHHLRFHRWHSRGQTRLPPGSLPVCPRVHMSSSLTSDFSISPTDPKQDGKRTLSLPFHQAPNSPLIFSGIMATMLLCPDTAAYTAFSQSLSFVDGSKSADPNEAPVVGCTVEYAVQRVCDGRLLYSRTSSSVGL
jgi:hypothetical protein